MIHVPQRHAHDCGVAVAAMLAGVTYDRAAEALTATAARGVSGRAMARGLTAITGHRWRAVGLPGLGAFGLGGVERAGVLLSFAGGAWHWVAVSGGWVFDPESEAPEYGYSRTRNRVEYFEIHAVVVRVV